jgi:two-component SAPR family response regulator
MDEHFHKVVLPAHSCQVCFIDNLVPALRAVTSTRDIFLLHQVMWDMNFQENRDQVKRLRPDLYIVSIPSLKVFADEHRLIDAVARPLYKDMVTWYSHFEFRAKHVPVVRVDAERTGMYGLLHDHLVDVIRS